MSKIQGKAYTFDDLALVPVYNNVSSRLDPSTETWLTKSIKLDIPVVSSPMDTVTGPTLAKHLLELGGMPIFPRATSIDAYREVYRGFGSDVFVATSVHNHDEIEAVLHLGFNKILLDTANGHTKAMKKAIKMVKRYDSRIEVIAGNVCTADGYRDLHHWGADAVRVGVGPGAACTTRMVTGVGIPQMTAIFECAEEAKKWRTPIIADGGIRSSRELSLAIAAGATTVMCGKVLALTYESEAEKRYISHDLVPSNLAFPIRKMLEGMTEDSYVEAKYRGQASEDFQKDHYGEVKMGTVAEGVCFWAKVAGPIDDVVGDLIAGFRSSMTYLGALDIKEYQRKAAFVEVTNTYMLESNPRGE